MKRILYHTLTIIAGIIWGIAAIIWFLYLILHLIVDYLVALCDKIDDLQEKIKASIGRKNNG